MRYVVTLYCNCRLVKYLFKSFAIMIICIQKKYTLQIMATNKQRCPNLRMPVESNKTYLTDESLKGNYNLDITNIV